MSRPDKRQRHKAKREAKRRELRRHEALSPVTRLADAPGEIDCWMSDGLTRFGQAQIFVYKRAAGLSGIAAFLIDRGVVGLKDAWTRMGVERDELDDMVKRGNERDIVMRRATPEQARQMIAGAARWAYDNGMRLPKHWLKAAALLGGVGDWAAADVSAFAKEFAGHPDDLRQRLVSEPFETYIQRTDIRFVLSEDAPYDDQDDDVQDDDVDEDDAVGPIAIASGLSRTKLDAMLAHFTTCATKLTVQTTRWLTDRGQTPSPQLFESWRLLMLSGVFPKTVMPGAANDKAAEIAMALIKNYARRIEESEAADFELAMKQATEHSHAEQQAVKRIMSDTPPG